MINVPANYLLFLYNDNEGKKTYGAMTDVMDYVRENLDVLEKENNK